MRASRRRKRTPVAVASPDAIRAVLDQLRGRLPGVVPVGEKLTIKMLNAVRHVDRHPASGTSRGRPSRWGRKNLLTVAAQLRSILSRESKGRVSLNSFIGLHLRVLDFPKDVTKALMNGDINLFEAAQLARLTEGRLKVSAPEARECRRKIMRAHLLSQGSQASLRIRVNEQLGELDTQTAQTVVRPVGADPVDELLELNPYDTKHLFWEELRRITIALRDVTPEEVDEKTLSELLAVSDRLSGILVRIQKKRRKRK